MNMCIAFLFFYAVFLGGIERKPFPCDQKLEEIICTASAALINYFALSSMAWMCVEALHMYMLFVRATGSVIPRFLLFARMFGWGEYKGSESSNVFLCFHPKSFYRLPFSICVTFIKVENK